MESTILNPPKKEYFRIPKMFCNTVLKKWASISAISSY